MAVEVTDKIKMYDAPEKGTLDESYGLPLQNPLAPNSWYWQQIATILNALRAEFTQIKGVAVSGTNPVSPKVGDIWFYSTEGSYPYFGTPVTKGEVGYFVKGASSWTKKLIVDITSYGFSKIKGAALSQTNPGSSEEGDIYFYSTKGTYPYFGTPVTRQNEIGFFKKGASSWDKVPFATLFTYGMQDGETGISLETILDDISAYSSTTTKFKVRGESLKDASVQLSSFSQAVLDYIGSGGAVTNQPDERHLDKFTEGTEKLRIKDGFEGKIYLYNPSQYATAADLKTAVEALVAGGNKHLVISDNIDGGGLTWTLPTGTIIDVARSGRITNVTLDGDYEILKKPYQVFGSSVTFSGTPHASDGVTPEMWGGAVGSPSWDAFNAMFTFVDLAKCTIDAGNGEYHVNKSLNLKHVDFKSQLKLKVTSDYTHGTSNGYVLFLGTEKESVSTFKDTYVNSLTKWQITENYINSPDLHISFDSTSDLSSLSKGGFLMLWSDEKFSGVDDYKAEAVKIFEVDNVKKKVILTKPIKHNYDTLPSSGYTVNVAPIEMNVCNMPYGISITGLNEWEYDGGYSGDKLLHIMSICYADNMNVGSIHLDNYSNTGLAMHGNYGGKIKSAYFSGAYPSGQPTGYGVVMYAPNYGVSIDKIDAETVRHAFDSIGNFGGTVSGHGLNDQITINGGNWNGADNTQSNYLFGCHGAIGDIDINNVVFTGNSKGVQGSIVPDYLIGTSYDLDKIVSEQDTSIYKNKYMQSLVPANLGNALSDATKWTMRRSFVAYTPDIETWVSGGTAVLGKTYRFATGYWLANKAGLLSDPDYGVDGWTQSLYYHDQIGIFIRNLTGNLRFNGCKFNKLNKIFKFTATSGEGNVYFDNNCVAKKCETFYYISTDDDSSNRIHVNDFKFEYVNALISFAALPANINPKIEFTNCSVEKSSVFGINGTTSGFTVPPQIERINFINTTFENLSILDKPNYGANNYYLKINDASHAFKELLFKGCTFDKYTHPIVGVWDNVGGIDFEITLDECKVKMGTGNDGSPLIMKTNASRVNIVNSPEIDLESNYLQNPSFDANNGMHVDKLDLRGSRIKSSATVPLKYIFASELLTDGVDSDFSISPYTDSLTGIPILNIGSDNRLNGVKVFKSDNTPEAVIYASEGSICYANGITYTKTTDETVNTGWGVVQGTGSDESALTTYTLDCRLNNKFKKTIGAATTFTFDVGGYAIGQFIKFNIWAESNAGVGVAPSYALSTGTLTVKSKASNYNNTLFTNIEIGLYITASGADSVIYETSS